MAIFRPRFSFLLAALGCLTSLAFAAPAFAAPGDYFRIDVVDADTGRGVPLVELKTTNEVRYYTDSNGIVAVGDPELMGQNVYFHVKSHGYEYPKDMFGYRGLSMKVTPGGHETVKIQRINVAERLYRITGAGIYRDSILVGAKVPLAKPLLDGLVMGQDTVHAIPYKGKIFWLWGDTNKPSHPLGNFFTTSATSLLPGKGGLDPSVGIDLTYYVDKEGFAKKMMQMPGNNPVWMGGLFTMNDDKGQERLFGSYSQVESDSKSNESGLAVFNDATSVFDKVSAYDTILRPSGRPFKVSVNGQKYLYMTSTLRVIADYKHVTDPTTYEAYTCLMPGARFDGANTQLQRQDDGKLVYGWKANTAELDSGAEKKLIEAKKMAPEEALFQFHDVLTGAAVQQHGSSIFWNDYRKRWVRIFSQAYGTSYLGELWYAEGDTPTGPWVYAQKILTHDDYTFYNPAQHPFFDQDGGRIIYFEGTYTSTYSGNKDHTPRYDYNQMMYRLTLDDPRLNLPVPVYHLKSGDYTLRSSEAGRVWTQAQGAPFQDKPVQDIPFFGMQAAGKGKSGLIPVYAVPSGDKNRPLKQLQLAAVGDAKPLFYALPATLSEGEKPSSDVVPLYEYTDTRNNQKLYSTNANEQGDGLTRIEAPLFRVWRNPSTVLPLDIVTPQADN